jgi:hypothetical protein
MLTLSFMFKFVKKIKEEKVKKETLKREDSFSRVKTSFEVKDSINGDFNYFLENFRDKSLVMLIIGRRGGGKTALGMKFVEVGKILNKRSYVIGFENSKVPKWVKKANDLEEVPNNSLVLVDEAGISFSARDSMKKGNKEMANLLAIARHKNLSLIFITQNSAMLDLNVLRLADVLLFKEPSLLQSRFERKNLQDMFQKVGENFKDLDNRKNYSYVISDDFEGMIYSSLPGFWNESISKSFSKK